MKFRIHVERSADCFNVEDTFIVEGDTVEEIREKAEAALWERNLRGAEVWSEEMK